MPTHHNALSDNVVCLLCCWLKTNARTHARTHDQSYGMTKTNKTVRFVHKWVRVYAKPVVTFARETIADLPRRAPDNECCYIGQRQKMQSSACLSIDPYTHDCMLCVRSKGGRMTTALGWASCVLGSMKMDSDPGS